MLKQRESRFLQAAAPWRSLRHWLYPLAFLVLAFVDPPIVMAQQINNELAEHAERSLDRTDLFSTQFDEQRELGALRNVLKEMVDRSKRGDSLLIDGIPEAEENARRMIESDVDMFVVGDGAEVTDRFRNTVLLTKIELSPSGGSPAIRPDRGLCSAVVISDRTLLTAAHCVCALGLDREQGRRTTQAIWGHGVINSSEIDSDRRAVVASQDGFRLFSPNFCTILRRDRRLNGPDIALVYLDEETIRDLAENTRIAPRRSPAMIAPPQIYLSRHLSNMTVVGYGISDFLRADGDTRYLPKVAAAVPVIDVICGRVASRRRFGCRAGEEIVLIDQLFGNDTCNGDSGGPAFIRHYGRYYLAGITSRAAIPSGDCGSGGIYTLLTRQIADWVLKNAKFVDPTF